MGSSKRHCIWGDPSLGSGNIDIFDTGFEQAGDENWNDIHDCELQCAYWASDIWCSDLSGRGPVYWGTAVLGGCSGVGNGISDGRERSQEKEAGGSILGKGLREMN